MIDALYNKIFSHFYDSSWIYSGLMLLSFSILLIIDFFINRQESAISRLVAKEKSIKIDGIVFLLDTLKLFPFLVFIWTFGIPWLVKYPINSNLNINVLHIIHNPILQSIIYIVVLDFLGYWAHRVLHRIDFLWEIHKLHHSASSMNIMTANRRHPLETGFRWVFFALPLALIGAPIETFIVATLFSIVSGQVHHLNANWSFGIIGKYLLVSPMYHKIHHSIEDHHFDKNFAIRFCIWDRVFGTYCAPEIQPITIGLRHNNFNELGYLKALISSTQSSIQKIKIRCSYPKFLKDDVK
jgi:sterol desaturase/sphingolipid hydroxylase (fatty acid hydroxylase superfamily)